jgi:hypothetical protein
VGSASVARSVQPRHGRCGSCLALRIALTHSQFMAHSNYMELCLVKLGHKDVFTFAGADVRIEAPNGEKVAPLLTGTFGGDEYAAALAPTSLIHFKAPSTP